MNEIINQTKQGKIIGKAAKAGAVLFTLWAVLHLWVGFEGIHQYLTSGAPGLWNMLTGGSAAPRETFQHATNGMTANAQAHLILNFCIDVAGYGVLGLVVGYLIWFRGSWTAYFLGLIIIGIADLAFLFSMVTPGIIELNAGTLGGPVIWILACIITPFGLPKFDKSASF